LLFFELLNEVHCEISIGGAPGAGCASVRLFLRGFGARIRQRLGVVTRLSCFLGVFD
jgi:hypothetical protein